MNRLAAIVASLTVGEIVELTSAHRAGGQRVVETHRAVVRHVDPVPRPNHRGVNVVGLTYSPAWDEPAWCGHGCYFAATEGPEPQWSVTDIRRTGERERRQPAPWSPTPGDRAYDSMC